MKMKLTFVAGTYSITHVRNAEIKQLSPLVFTMLWDIDLIFGMWVYNDKLQIKFTFMIIHSHTKNQVNISNRSEIKWWQLNIWTNFKSPTAVSWPKIIQPEEISKMICNLWLYTLIPKIKSISQINVMFYRYRTSYSYASVVDSWSHQGLVRQYCFLE
jgi:hypothetical protein